MSATTDLASTTALTTTLPAPAAAPSPAASPVGPNRGRGQPAEPARSTAPETVDDRFLREAREAVEAEEAAKGQAPKPVAAAPPTPRVQAPALAGQPRGRGPVVPVQVVESLRGELRDAKAQIARLAAAVANPAVPVAAAPAPTPDPTYDDRRFLRDHEIGTLNNHLAAAAKDYDDGKITSMEALHSATAPLWQQIFNLKLQDAVEFVLGKVPETPRPVMGIADRMLLTNQLTELEAKYPWVLVINPDEMKWLEGVVNAEMQALGINMPAGPEKAYELRKRVAEASAFYGPRWHPEYRLDAASNQLVAANQGAPVPAPTTQIAAPQPQQPTAQIAPPRLVVPPPSNFPPNPTNLGAGAQGGALVMTEEGMLTMPYEDLGALPPQRVAGAR